MMTAWTRRQRRQGRPAGERCRSRSSGCSGTGGPGLTIAQVPNVPLWVFLGAVLVRAVADPTGGLRTALDTIAGVALAAWAVDEIVRGVNPWRRILGVGVLFLAALSWMRR
jgi:hypothetical protein